LSTKHPLAFGFLITIVFILLVLASSILVGRASAAETSGWYIGSTIGRLVSIFILLIVLSRLGWLHSAGFTSLGQPRTWLMLIIPLAYSIAVSAYAMTGNLDFSSSDPLFTSIVILFLMTHALLEEIAFRGLIMHSFIRAWGSTNRGVLRSVLVSSLFFGGMHVIYPAGEPLQIVLFRIIAAFLLGIFFRRTGTAGRKYLPCGSFPWVIECCGLSEPREQRHGSDTLLMAVAEPLHAPACNIRIAFAPRHRSTVYSLKRRIS